MPVTREPSGMRRASAEPTSTLGDSGLKYELWKGWKADQFGATTAADAAYFEAEVFRQLGLPPGARLLEVGFGNGYFMGYAKSRGHSIAGIEHNPSLIERATRAGFEAYDAPDALRADTYDAVVAIDVLEHIPVDAAADFLRGIGRCLKPGGRILLRFPNGDSPFGRIWQHGDVTHINVIGSHKIAYLAAAAGLVVERTKNPERPVSHLGAKRRIAEFVRRRLAASIEGLVGWTFFGTRLPIAPNLVVILRKP